MIKNVQTHFKDHAMFILQDFWSGWPFFNITHEWVNFEHGQHNKCFTFVVVFEKLFWFVKFYFVALMVFSPVY